MSSIPPINVVLNPVLITIFILGISSTLVADDRAHQSEQDASTSIMAYYNETIRYLGHGLSKIIILTSPRLAAPLGLTFEP